MTPLPSTIFWLLLGITAAQRLHELRRSGLNQARLREVGFARVDSGPSYPLMVAVHASWFVAMIVEALTSPKTVPAPLQYLTMCVFLGAQALRYWAIISLGEQWNTQVMSPKHSEADQGVVSIGPYRFIRHPNYLAVILEFISLPLLGGALITTLIWSAFNGAVLIYRIKLEEAHLIKRPGYEQSVGRLPRLIPSILPRTKAK